MTQTFPRQHIAEQRSDLRQMRGALADLITAACGLLARGDDVPATIRFELVAALSHAEKADKIAQERMRELFDMKTPQIANDDREEAA